MKGKQNQSIVLWKTRIERLSGTRYLVLADTAEVATRKTVRRAKQDGYKNPKVIEVTYEGTIDVF